MVNKKGNKSRMVATAREDLMQFVNLHNIVQKIRILKIILYFFTGPHYKMSLLGL